MSNHLSQQALESYLWGAATLLRGLVDAGDYKQYIFPPLFFKRLSDVWDDDYDLAFVETGDEGYATADDPFVIPEGGLWEDVREAQRDMNVGIWPAPGDMSYRVRPHHQTPRLQGARHNGSAS